MLEKETEEALNQFLNQLVTEMRQVLDSRGMTTTGKSKSLIEARVFGSVGELYAPTWILQLERGRGPTRSSQRSNPPLWQIIRQWIIDKGISLEGMTVDQVAFAMTKVIHERGTKLFQRRGSTGIISQTITQQRLDAFEGVYTKIAYGVMNSDVDFKFKGLFK